MGVGDACTASPQGRAVSRVSSRKSIASLLSARPVIDDETG